MKEKAKLIQPAKSVLAKLGADLEPLMSVDMGRHFTQAGQKMFGAIGDSAPDRFFTNALQERL